MAPEVISKTSNTADQAAGRVLAINPGTTSTKFGIFTRAGEELTQNIHHGDEEIQRFKGRPMLDRLEYRAELIEKALAEAGFAPKGETQGARSAANENRGLQWRGAAACCRRWSAAPISSTTSWSKS